MHRPFATLGHQRVHRPRSETLHVPMAVTFTLEELARRTGEPVSTLKQWQRLGLIGGEPFEPPDLERARLFQFLGRHGIPAERIAEACGDGLATSITRYLSSLFPSDATDACTVEQAARRTGMPQATTERL